MTKVYLGKWPKMVVTGKHVTPLQAREIIVRTSGLFFSTNNDKFRKALLEHITGRKSKDSIYSSSICDYYNDIHDIHQLIDKYGLLADLEFLTNQRICSAYIGGPHRWVDWNGTVFTDSYCIGKYPEVENIEHEWKLIQDAFPYLDLVCQLYWTDEDGDAQEPLVQFRVKDGNVVTTFGKYIERIDIKPQELDINEDLIMNLFLNPDRELGCTLDFAKESYDIVEKIMKDKP